MGVKRWALPIVVATIVSAAIAVLVVRAGHADRHETQIVVFDGPRTFCGAEASRSMVQAIALVRATPRAGGLRSQVAHVRAQITRRLAADRSTPRQARPHLLALSRALERARRTDDYRAVEAEARQVDRVAERCR